MSEDELTTSMVDLNDIGQTEKFRPHAQNLIEYLAHTIVEESC